MAITGMDAARKVMSENGGIVMPFEKGYNAWNESRKNPAPSPEKVLEERAKKADEDQSEALKAESDRLAKEAEKLDNKKKGN